MIENREKKRYYFLRAVVIVVILLIIIGLIKYTVPTPTKILNKSLQNLKQGDFEKVSEYLNYEQLVDIPILNGDKKDEIQKLLFEDLEFKILNTQKNGDIAKIEVEITNKNFETIIQNYTKTVMQSVFGGEQVEPQELLIQELKNNEEKVTNKIEITAENKDGKWNLIIDDEVKKALFPGFYDAWNDITSATIIN